MVLDSVLSVNRTVFQHNVAAHYAPVLHADGRAKGKFSSCTFDRNEAHGYERGIGAAVMLLSGNANVNIVQCDFIKNSAVNYGGAIQIRAGSVVHIAGSNFSSNKATLSGGAIFVEESVGAIWNQTALTSAASPLLRPEVVITSSHFEQNVAGEYGAALALSNVVVRCTQCTGMNNTATMGGGFGALLHTNSSLMMTDSTISHNTAGMSGGAFLSRAIQEGDLLRAVEWSANPGSLQAAELIGRDGGGGGRLTLQSTTVVGNTATLWHYNSTDGTRKMTGHGGALAFWYWPRTPSIDAWSASAMVGNQAGGGGLAFLLDRQKRDDEDYSLAAFATRLVQPKVGLSALETMSDNLALYGSKIATSGGSVTLSQTQADYKFSPGLLINPKTKSRLQVDATFKDSFDQTVATCGALVCLLSGKASGAPCKLVGGVLQCEQMVSGTRKLVSEAGMMHYEDLQLTGFFGGSTNLNVECSLDASAVTTLKASQRLYTSPPGSSVPVLTDDCPRGWFPVISKRIQDWVRICAPCNPGFFSPEINSECYACPQKATSDEGAFGIRGCYCEAGQYLDYNTHSGDPEDAKTMSCVECEDGEQCGGKTYPVPKSQNWFSSPENTVYECPFEDVCNGFTDTFGNMTNYMELKAAEEAASVSNDARRSWARRDSALPSRNSNWDTVSDMQCAEGHKGVLCAVCWDDWQLTDTGCQECGGSASKVLLTWLGLIIAVILILPIAILGIKKIIDSRRAEEEAAKAETEEKEPRAGLGKQQTDSQGAALVGAVQNFQMNQDLQGAVDAGDNEQSEDDEDEEEDDEDEEEMDSDDEFMDDELNDELEDTAETEQDEGVQEGNVDKLMDSVAGQLQVLISHFQVMSSFSVSIDIEWPSMFGDFCNVFAFLSLDVNSLFALGCVASTNYYGSIMITFLLPTIAFPLIVVVAFICIEYCELEKESVKNKAWLASLYLMFLIYPNCCATFLSTFYCHTVEETDYLVMDYSLTCYDSEWSFYAGISIAGICLYCIGIPLLDYIILFQNQHKLFISEKFEGRFGFIYGRFQEEYFYWELVEMLRKFVMGGLLMFVKSGTFEQVVVGIIMAGAFLMLQFRFRPFAEDVDNNLAIMGGIATTCTMLMAVLVKAGSTGAGTSLVIMSVNLMVLVCSLYNVFFKVLPDFIEDQERKLRKVLYIANKAKKKAMEKLADNEEEDKQCAQEYKPNDKRSDDISKQLDETPESESEDPESEEPELQPEEPELEASEDGLDKVELRETQLKYFNRYDLDGSKTINSSEELMQLCTNLTVKLNLKVRIADLQDLVDENDLDAAQWDFKQFTEWFDDKILPHRA